MKFWAVVENSECASPPPTSLPLRRNCNEIACPPEYVTGPWSQVSKGHVRNES